MLSTPTPSPRRKMVGFTDRSCSPTVEEPLEPKDPSPPRRPLLDSQSAPQFNMTFNMTTNVNLSGTNSQKLAAQWFRYGQSSSDVYLPAMPHNTDRFVALAGEMLALPRHNHGSAGHASAPLVREVLDTVECALQRRLRAAPTLPHPNAR